MEDSKLLSRGLRKLEWHIRIVVIPFFAAILTYMTWDFCPNELHLPYFITNLIGITIGWFLGKKIIFWLKRKMPKRTAKRIVIQLIASMVATFLFVIVYIYVKNFFFDDHEFMDFISGDPIFKIISGASLIYMFVLNAMYEGFFLFREMSDMQLETEKYKKANAEAQLKNLTSKLNPHFLFNSFNTLVTIIEENKEKAVDFVQKLSDVYRYVLNSDKQTWVKLEDEIRFSKSYVSLLKMRFESNFNVNFEVGDEYNNAYILPLTLQLLIENAVKHNEISDYTHLNLFIEANLDWLAVSNEINMRKTNENNSTKVGLTNIKERYQLLTKKGILIENGNGHFVVKIPLINLKTAT